MRKKCSSAWTQVLVSLLTNCEARVYWSRSGSVCQRWVSGETKGLLRRCTWGVGVCKNALSTYIGNVASRESCHCGMDLEWQTGCTGWRLTWAFIFLSKCEWAGGYCKGATSELLKDNAFFKKRTAAKLSHLYRIDVFSVWLQFSYTIWLGILSNGYWCGTVVTVARCTNIDLLLGEVVNWLV